MRISSRLPKPLLAGVRLALGIAAAVASGYASLAMLFIGSIEYTGCFLECSAPNRPIGGLLLLGAAGSAAAAITALTYAFFDRRFPLVTTFLIAASGAVVLVMVIVAS